MQRVICKKLYDTEASTLIKKVTCGFFGDADGYEETLYQTQSGHFFIYTNGGPASKYTQEKIKRIGAVRKDAWLKDHE